MRKTKFGSLIPWLILALSLQGCATFAKKRPRPTRTANPAQQQTQQQVKKTAPTNTKQKEKSTRKQEQTAEVTTTRMPTIQQIAKKLLHENNQLRKQVEQLERLQREEREQHFQRLQSMDHTISLMELNIKDMEQKLLTLQNASLTGTTPTKPIEESTLIATVEEELPEEQEEKPNRQYGLSQEFKTPTKSKAVETFSLLPKATTPTVSSSSPKKSKKERIKKEVTPKPIIVPLPEKKRKSRLNLSDNQWEDPDLLPPKAPLTLRVYPGAKVLYKGAFKSYTKRNYQQAIEQFEEFLRRYPNDQDADNSQFWIGQSFFRLGDYLQAEHAFRKVLKNYPHGDTRRGYKTPDSILMLGKIYQTRGKPIKARSYFQEIRRKYPSSRSAVKAEKELQAMSSF